ncbi:hypothetical protein ANN_06868 [Periplaneta americana]|uniref:Uncharacterized protein n=1 Tax=Periplaneta americana TaxID=6978 RepID=A0ABQ8TGM7_PERAM|nr:hypothetical protein ANN_06868 [Periplaneta americana]
MSQEYDFRQGVTYMSQDYDFRHGVALSQQDYDFRQVLTYMSQDYDFLHGVALSQQEYDFRQGVTYMSQDYDFRHGVALSQQEYDFRQVVTYMSQDYDFRHGVALSQQDYDFRQVVTYMSQDYDFRQGVTYMSQDYDFRQVVTYMSQDYDFRQGVTYMSQDYDFRQGVTYMSQDYDFQHVVTYMSQDYDFRQVVTYMSQDYEFRQGVTYMSQDYHFRQVVTYMSQDYDFRQAVTYMSQDYDFRQGVTYMSQDYDFRQVVTYMSQDYDFRISCNVYHNESGCETNLFSITYNSRECRYDAEHRSYSVNRSRYRESKELNGLHQLLVYADDVTLLGENPQKISKNTEILLETSKEYFQMVRTFVECEPQNSPDCCPGNVQFITKATSRRAWTAFNRLLNKFNIICRGIRRSRHCLPLKRNNDKRFNSSASNCKLTHFREREYRFKIIFYTVNVQSTRIIELSILIAENINLCCLLEDHKFFVVIAFCVDQEHRHFPAILTSRKNSSALRLGAVSVSVHEFVSVLFFNSGDQTSSFVRHVLLFGPLSGVRADFLKIKKCPPFRNLNV